MLQIDLDAFGKAANWMHLSPEIVKLDFPGTTLDPQFPGALLPVVRADGSVIWYAAAATGSEWRALQPLLSAYVGPTVTDFRGQTSALDDAIPIEQIIKNSGVYGVARLVPGESCAEYVVGALSRLREGIRRRPAGPKPVPEPTSRLLARLEMALVAGDREGARDLLEILRAEMRLDTLNLHFLEVRILAAFREWREIVDADWFIALSLARKPASVATEMLHALWYERLVHYADDQEKLRTHYVEEARSLAKPLLEQASEEDEIVARFLQFEGLEANRPSSSGEAAHALLDRAAEAPSADRVADVHSAIAALATDDRDTLLHSGAGQRALAEIGSLEEPAPKGWLEWLQQLSEPRFSRAVAAARDGVVEWTSAGTTSTEQAKQIATELLRLGVSDEIGRDRLIESLPSLVRWVKDDPQYPRKTLREIYEVLLQLFSLLDHRDNAERDAAADLLDAVLTSGTNAEEYRALLEDFSNLIDRGAGRSSIYWLLDLAAILLQHPTPDPDARLKFLNLTLSSFQPLLKLLTWGQRASYNLVASGASWPALPSPEAGLREPGAERLKGKSIAIYTLTESAGRQAEAALKEIDSSINVSLAHDHVASPRLVRLARDADIFVLAAASAKHAATDCILANRQDRAVLYAAGRGFSSIVRALERYASEESYGSE